MNKKLATTIIFGFALSASILAGQNEWSGNNVPAYMRAAIKQLDGNVPAAERIMEDQVVVIQEIERFFRDHGVTDPKSQAIMRERQAFVLSNAFPIFVNAWQPSFRQASEAFERNESVISELAAVLRHEAVHARGNQDEVEAYGAEIEYLRAMQKKGKLRTPKAEQYIAQLKAFRDRFITGTEKNGAVMVKMSK